MPKNISIEDLIREFFTDEQFQEVYECLKAIKEHGRGGVKIIFNNHHVVEWESWPVFRTRFEKPRSGPFE